jgi:hypothetical protein
VGGIAPARLGPLATASQDEKIELLADTARFKQDDPDVLVLASFACPLCLHSEQVRWEAALEGYDPSVQCRCPSCPEEWSVYLTPEQAVRLGLIHVHAG